MLRSLPFAVACVVTASSTAFAADVPKWQGHTELEGKWGTERSLGEMGVFIPVWQDGDTLLAADIRQRIDDANSQEGNYGLSLRQLFAEQDMILGGYAFFDRRRTPNANVFNQATLGAEALWTDYEARLNVYIPESTEEEVSAASSSASVVGSSIQVQTFSGASERALPGFDAELGAKFDLSEEWKLWLYGGGFYFDSDGYDTVAGPRARLELSRGNLPLFGQGSRLTLGLEAQHDNVRGDQAFAIARIRVPFAAFGGQGQADDLSALEQRMTGRIYRDVDIVSGESASQLISTEAATVSIAGHGAVDEIHMIDATDNIVSEVSAAGADALIVLDGSAGTINTASAINTQTGQFITSGPLSLTATGTTSGNTASLNLSASRATVHGTVTFANIFELADDVTIDGVDMSGGRNAIHGNGVTNIEINDVNITNTSQTAIDLSNTSGAIQNVTIATTDRDGIGLTVGSNVTIDNADISGTNFSGLFVSSSTARMDNSYIHDTGTNGIYSYIAGANLTLNNTDIENTGSYAISVGDTALDGSGNNIIAPTFGSGCDNNGGNTGSIAFDDILGGGMGNCP